MLRAAGTYWDVRSKTMHDVLAGRGRRERREMGSEGKKGEGEGKGREKGEFREKEKGKEGRRRQNDVHFLGAYLVLQGHETLCNLEMMVTQWVRVHDGSIFMVGDTRSLYREVLASFPGQEGPGMGLGRFVENGPKASVM